MFTSLIEFSRYVTLLIQNLGSTLTQAVTLWMTHHED